MSTHDLYITPVPESTRKVPPAGATRFTWEYDDGRENLLALYQKGKDRQWDSVKRIDWDLDVDPYNVLGIPDQSLAIYGTKYWDKLSPRDRAELRRHSASWQFSQFMHGEQGAMVTAAKIVETAPDLDAKFYSATQTMDEARHVEVFARFLQEKIGLVYPINTKLQDLLAETLTDARWDMPFLGMQVLIEGLALAAFGVMRDVTTQPLPRQILAYVMQDEARHVAFGRMALRDLYRDLSDAERRDREEFVIQGCHLMRDRIRSREVWEHFGLATPEVRALIDESPYMRMFQSLLFSRIVPCVKDIGLWSPRIRETFEEMGVLEASRADLDALMRGDEEIADRLDAQRFAAEEAARRAEVDAVIAAEAASS
ncbi:ribonucleotide-diphosphate reductase subunit beta [Actinomadura rubteroloni]|uniref:Ribonucleotide-diphosphate reductase subunit beta n=1 Tax=Actinomadura rubteroloni TaxID=1926885 RepID=A0A2P4UR83_9ACTN|nr:ferritin-like domain-containing protein [Actinomadura rubteroloni]POM27555.1 ribonucleotide-diphosphate reductase subunit beta [Actinomadura rubteroloni]